MTDFKSRGLVEDLAGPILAWRGWGVGTDASIDEVRRVVHSAALGNRLQNFNPKLTLISTSTLGGLRAWPTGREGGLVAECRCNWRFRRHRRVPGRGPGLGALILQGPRVRTCGYGCGIYAMTSYEKYVVSPWGNSPIRGAVLLGGRVWEHQDGYRAEKATVQCLVLRGLEGLRHEMEAATDRQVQQLADRYEVPTITETEAFEYGRNWQADQEGTAPGAGPLDVPGAPEGTEPPADAG